MIDRQPRPSPPPGFVNRPPARPMPPPWAGTLPQPGMNVPLPPSTHDRPQWAGPGMVGEPAVGGWPDDQPMPNPYAERMAAYLRLMARRG